MTDFQLDPAYVQIFYTTPYAPHKMTLPTRAWVAGSGNGTYTAWDGITTVDADAMIRDLVTAIAAAYNNTVTFNRYTIYTKSSPTAIPAPVTGNTLGIVGSGTYTGDEKATQVTHNYRSVLFNPFRLVMLDRPVDSGSFTKFLSPPSAVDTAIAAEFFDVTEAWAARDKTQPVQFVSWVATLNNRLRREYHIR